MTIKTIQLSEHTICKLEERDGNTISIKVTQATENQVIELVLTKHEVLSLSSSLKDFADNHLFNVKTDDPGSGRLSKQFLDEYG